MLRVERGDKSNYLDGFARLEFFDGSGPEHAWRRR
jgi:hypothetical protein